VEAASLRQDQIFSNENQPESKISGWFFLVSALFPRSFSALSHNLVKPYKIKPVTEFRVKLASPSR
jgi:hypothetical protein